MVAGGHLPALLVAADEAGRLAKRRRSTEDDALLAAAELALGPGRGDDVDIAHAGTDDPEDLAKHRVLHRGRRADESDLLGALHRLDRVDELGRIDEGGPAGQRLADRGEEPLRLGARSNETDR